MITEKQINMQDDYSEETKTCQLRPFRYMSTQRERISESLLSNSVCESSPTAMHKGTLPEKLMNLRPRDVNKEVGPPFFRFKASTGAERVLNSIQGVSPSVFNSE